MLTISDAAQRAGLTSKAVRYYSDIGLLPEAGRSAAGYRLYDQQSVDTLIFLRRARDFGFTISQCKDLLALLQNPDRSAAEVKSIASQHLLRLEQQRLELEKLCSSLNKLVSLCPGDDSPDCPIISHLS